MAIEVYSALRTCPKCGKKAEHKSRHFREINYGAVIDMRREFIRRTCERCGYKWDELPLNLESKGDSR